MFPALREGGVMLARGFPLTKYVAQVFGCELDVLKGSGPRGRITRADVLAAAGITEQTGPAPGAPPSPHSDGGPEFEIEKPTRVQRLIARRMAESKATVPDFEVEVGVDTHVHDLLVDRNGLKRDSDGFFARGGSTFEITRSRIPARRFRLRSRSAPIRQRSSAQ